MLNLVVNARDAMPEGGRLVIETDGAHLDETYVSDQAGVRPGPYVRLTVSDTGTGMTDEVKARLFEPFFTTKERGKGSGLGLATVHGIVKQNGGHIWIYSELNRGTTFKIYLPSGEGEVAPHVRPVEEEPARGSERVLVVEDERPVRFLVRTILRRCGYEVFEAEGPEAADAWLGDPANQLDLLITDVIMPGGSGPELYQSARASRPTLRVIYMSGYTDDAIARDRLLEPGVAFVQKPFTADDLLRKVRALLDE
jgi:CheY-like chemotaxis protein